MNGAGLANVFAAPELVLEPSAEMPRRLELKFDGRDGPRVRAAIRAGNGGFAVWTIADLDDCRTSLNGNDLWVGRAAFDLTDDELSAVDRFLRQCRGASERGATS